jgi:AraC-like DNA-binding protein
MANGTNGVFIASAVTYLTGRSLSAFKIDFQAVFNETPSRWLVRKRLEDAYYLIDKRSKKPSEIYMDLGFEALSHFSFAFKKLYGHTPTEVSERKQLYYIDQALKLRTGETIEKKTLITGGASGIGLGLTERLIKENNTVIICGRRKDLLNQVADKFPAVISRQCLPVNNN